MCGKCRPEVEAFAEAMEDTLRDNDHKGGWRTTSIPDLLGRLKEEVAELEQLLVGSPLTGINPHVLRKEAADVANFAMMIADNFGALKT